MEDLAAQEEETGERQRDRISPHPASYTTRRGGKEGKGREEQEIPGGKDEDILAVVPPNTPEGTVHRTSVASQVRGGRNRGLVERGETISVDVILVPRHGWASILPLCHLFAPDPMHPPILFSSSNQLVGILLFPFVLLGGATGRLSEALSSSPSRLSTLAASSAPSSEGRTEEEGEEGVDIPPP